MEEKLVIIDTDVGVDDANALFMALSAHNHSNIQFKLIAITCVVGNTHLEQVIQNLSHVFNIGSKNGNDKIPIYKGCSQPILTPYMPSSAPFHGYNGFGDIELPTVDLNILNLQEENAVMALIRLSKEYKGKISLLTLGPLTNLALAVRLDPSIKSNFKEIYIMGGNIEGVGNTSVCSEFNFLVDPEGAHITLSTYQCPIYIVPWEVCHRHSISLEWRKNILGQIGTNEIELINKVEAKSFQFLDSFGEDQWIACDEFVVASFINPKIITEIKSCHSFVELSGQHTRGQMIIDHRKLLGKEDNVKIITRVDLNIFKNMLIWGLGGSSFYE